MMASKLVSRILAGLAVAVLCTACGERESKREAREESDMAAPMGCCQKSDMTCESPVTEMRCSGMNGSFLEGGACGADGKCGMEPQ